MPFELIKTYFPWNEDIQTSLQAFSLPQYPDNQCATFDGSTILTAAAEASAPLLGSMSRSHRCGGRISPLAVHKRTDDCHNATVS